MEFLCPWESAQYFFFSSEVPPLLYYSHFIAILAAVILALVLIPRVRESLAVRLFITTIFFFTAWTIIDIPLWALNRPDISLFLWSLQVLVEMFVYASAFYFAYAFIAQKDLKFLWKIGLFVLLTPIIVLLPTPYLFPGISTECVVSETPFFNFFSTYSFEIFLSFLILFISFWGIKTQSARRTEIILFTTGVIVFLIAFSSGNIVGSITGDWNLAQAGLFGMSVFIAFLTYSIVKFKTFNVKLFAAQVLVSALAISVLAILFLQTISNVRIIAGITFVFVCILGYLLVRGVKREIEQRERIEKLAKELEGANVRLKDLDRVKTEFVSIASHQLRSPLAAIKGYASMLLESSFGKISVGAHEAVGRIFSSSSLMARSIEDFLNVSRIELGQMKYDLAPFDICKLVETVIEEQTPIAEDKKLTLKLFRDKSVTTCDIFADIGKIKQVLTNFVDNAIKYTPRGSITITFSRDSKHKVVRVGVTDTGMGMSPETIKKLFVKFSRADNANRVNVIGTGLGLFVAKQLIEAHGGRVWAESSGEGKGSTFFFELPLEAKGTALAESSAETIKPPVKP